MDNIKVQSVTIKAELKNEVHVKGQVVLGGTDSLPTYKGSYEVTPKTTKQVIETAQKVMKDDVTVFAIPFFETSNTSGGNTIYIGKEV